MPRKPEEIGRLVLLKKYLGGSSESITKEEEKVIEEIIEKIDRKLDFENLFPEHLMDIFFTITLEVSQYHTLDDNEKILIEIIEKIYESLGWKTVEIDRSPELDPRFLNVRLNNKNSFYLADGNHISSMKDIGPNVEIKCLQGGTHTLEEPFPLECPKCEFPVFDIEDIYINDGTISLICPYCLNRKIYRPRVEGLSKQREY